LRRGHLFVLPSFYEGLPLVLLEALASGCRLVATALPGVREIFADAPADSIRIVDLPGLDGPDQPRPEDLPAFVDHLTRALTAQISAAVTSSLDLAPAAALLGRYTWGGVFQRVSEVYDVLVRPVSKNADDVYGRLHKPGQRSVSTEAMDAAIARKL